MMNRRTTFRSLSAIDAADKLLQPATRCSTFQVPFPQPESRHPPAHSGGSLFESSNCIAASNIVSPSKLNRSDLQ
jgi:hypothetical protein